MEHQSRRQRRSFDMMALKSALETESDVNVPFTSPHTSTLEGVVKGDADRGTPEDSSGENVEILAKNIYLQFPAAGVFRATLHVKDSHIVFHGGFQATKALIRDYDTYFVFHTTGSTGGKQWYTIIDEHKVDIPEATEILSMSHQQRNCEDEAESRFADQMPQILKDPFRHREGITVRTFRACSEELEEHLVLSKWQD